MRRSSYRGRNTSTRSNVLMIFLVVLLFLAILFLLAVLFLTRLSQIKAEGNAVSPSPSSPASSFSEPVSPEPELSNTPAPTPSPSPSAPEESPSPSPDPDPDGLAWYLTLVNPTHTMPENYAVVTEPIYTTLSFDTRAVDALREMLAGCEAEGLSPLVCSAYRTQETQEKLFQNKVNEFKAMGYDEDAATEAAGRIVAVPGTSEHQLGLAADIVDATNQALDESQENTAVQKWLMEHCWEYGFILRYPNDKRELTGIIYEPWHYRYVGLEHAKAITESGLCLEEYLAQEYGVE